MNIVFGVPDLGIDSKYTALELDTFRFAGNPEPVTAYCVVENIPIMEMSQIAELKELHDSLISNYKQGQWDLCQDALVRLNNRWGGEMDSFYASLGTRINTMRQQPVPANWDGVIDKNPEPDTV